MHVLDEARVDKWASDSPLILLIYMFRREDFFFKVLLILEDR